MNDKFYKVTNYFGGVCEIFNDYESAKALFDKLMAQNNCDIELMEYTCNGGYRGHGIEYFYKGKYYTA